MTDLPPTKESGIPENLAYCSECGSKFGEPVEVDVALEYFPEVDLASFMCDRCAPDAEHPE